MKQVVRTKVGFIYLKFSQRRKHVLPSSKRCCLKKLHIRWRLLCFHTGTLFKICREMSIVETLILTSTLKTKFNLLSIHTPKYITCSEPLIKVFCALAQSLMLNVDVSNTISSFFLAIKGKLFGCKRLKHERQMTRNYLDLPCMNARYKAVSST